MYFDQYSPSVFPDDGSVQLIEADASWKIILLPASSPKKEITVTWKCDMTGVKKVLRDSWGVALGDLGWKEPDHTIRAEWYFAAFDGERTYGFGVKTGCDSFCSWQTSDTSVTLVCDVRNGGEGVENTEPVVCAETVFYESADGETPFEACRSFCRKMCDKPKLPGRAVYGTNTWLHTYGKITRASVLDEARFCAHLASYVEKDAPRPYTVIDAGWSKNDILGQYIGGPFAPNDDFYDMKSLAYEIKAAGCEPGIWIRPLQVLPDLLPELTPDCYSENQEYCEGGRIIDPTTRGAKEYISSLVSGLADSGYSLIKHDFTCPDIMGNNFLKPHLTSPGWHLKDRTKTNATVIKELYSLIQESAHGSAIIGCNVYSHLAAGIHDIMRSGCDTSGRDWKDTKLYGINCLVYRLCQNKNFFITDPDCAAFTQAVPTELNLRFAELISLTGSALFISAAQGILTSEDEERIMAMFRRVSRGDSNCTPVDWMDKQTPTEFISEDRKYEYVWDL